MNNKQYSYVKTLWKAGAAFISVLAPGVAAIEALPDDLDTFHAKKVVILTSAGLAVLKAGLNMWKNRDSEGSPIPAVQEKAKSITTSLHRGARGVLLTPAMLAPLLALPFLLSVGDATSAAPIAATQGVPAPCVTVVPGGTGDST